MSKIHYATVITHASTPGIACSCGWQVNMLTALGVINAYGDHRAAMARETALANASETVGDIND